MYEHLGVAAASDALFIPCNAIEFFSSGYSRSSWAKQAHRSGTNAIIQQYRSQALAGLQSAPNQCGKNKKNLPSSAFPDFQDRSGVSNTLKMLNK
ncbi:hypothetical protein PoB_003752900 [Plakobranchus ocellatus]|uniref:Uncharacterized protein n=1 Tax=Plakobranchus ocellatus TaxID=259542 RepID=A0AAV4AY15_9GAST|nr:hypothetical protein PoB_003752900 [Plakobranchus ocellatus]